MSFRSLDGLFTTLKRIVGAAIDRSRSVENLLWNAGGGVPYAYKREQPKCRGCLWQPFAFLRVI